MTIRDNAVDEALRKYPEPVGDERKAFLAGAEWALRETTFRFQWSKWIDLMGGPFESRNRSATRVSRWILDEIDSFKERS